MRVGLLAVCLFVLGCTLGFAQEAEEEAEQESAEASDAWLGCWAKVYDAAHLKQHPGQQVTAMTVIVKAREPEGDEDKGNYLATVRANFRNKPETFTNQDGARCEAVGANKDKLHCVADGVFLSDFWLEQSANNVKLAMRDARENLTLVPGIDPSAFVRLSAQNPEHSLFRLLPTACKS
jgi:hypothetical protein